MPIRINLDVMLARRKVKSCDLAAEIGITPQNLSILKTGKARAVRLETLASICRHLRCQPGDILEYIEEEGEEDGRH
jgi:putative transcriptional regulator